ncbi:MAG: hypothetical protein ACREQA_06445 [Candidatus Binatia bacterium]
MVGEASGNSRYLSRYWLLLVILALGALLTWQFWAQGAAPSDPRAVARAVTPRGDLAPDEKSTIALFRQASPSVVNITTLTVGRDFFSLNLLEALK